MQRAFDSRHDRDSVTHGAAADSDAFQALVAGISGTRRAALTSLRASSAFLTFKLHRREPVIPVHRTTIRVRHGPLSESGMAGSGEHQVIKAAPR